VEALKPSGAVVFIGFMGAGKSTAIRTAAASGLATIDTDERMVLALGMTIAEFFERHGEAAFREREEIVVCDLLDAVDGGAVALGGGSILSPKVRTALARHTVVALEVGVETAWIRAAGHDRPLASNRAEFEAIYAERSGLYSALAQAVLPEGSVVASALQSILALRLAPEHTRLLWATTTSSAYPVFIANALLASDFWPVQGRRFVVTDGTVASLYPQILIPSMGSATVMPGEQSKTIAHAEIVWTEMVRAMVTRSDHVAAIGGGVVGDLGGFCAATYQRGIPVVQVPTTIVSQVDSAYGGKTGVDLAEAKNYVGAYHQPAAVLVDPSLLETLSGAEYSAGFVEVIKTALISGGQLWERVRSGAPLDQEMIFDCARTKLAIVAHDERDDGRRQVLNLGHTVGHAIETVTGYASYRHGEAVGLGLLVALRLSGQDGLRSEVEALLVANDLPTRLEDVDVDDVVLGTTHDKKRLGEAPTPFVLVDAAGAVEPGRNVAPDAIRAAVEELTL